jgi:D-aspartate ligase
MSSKIARPRAIVDRPLTAKGALVMAADYRALGVVRSLGRQGIPVWVLKQGGHLVAAVSKYVRRNVSWSAAGDTAEVEQLLSLGAEHSLDGWLLFPTDDHAVALISRHHQLLSRQYTVTVPPWELLRFACDKRLLHETAGKLGIPQPWTTWPRSREELASLDCPFPVILKPATRFRPNTLAVPKAWRVDNRSSLLERYDQATAAVGPDNLIIQEILPRDESAQFSYAALCRNGRVVASVAARENRQYPMDFGQFSTFVETVEEPELAQLSDRLLRAVRFDGLIELEFKRDTRDGLFKILDVNPRVWGWHTLAKRAGVDFPYLLWRFLHDQPVPSLRGRSGERWIHLSGDIPAALQQLRHGRLTLREYLRSIKGPAEYALFASDDPAPGVLDLPLFAWCSIKRIFQRDEGRSEMHAKSLQVSRRKKVSSVETEPSRSQIAGHSTTSGHAPNSAA